MRRTLLTKAAVTFALALVLFVPLGAVRSTIEERHALSGSVLQDIKASGVREQRILGPILIVPYTRTTTAEVTDTGTGVKTIQTSTETGHLHFLPASLAIKAQVDTETRQRGIYSALVFRARHGLEGAFAVPEGFGVTAAPNVSYAWHDAYVVVGLGDTRGIRGTPTLRWNGRPLSWDAGTRGLGLGSGIHSVVGALPTQARRIPFAIQLDLGGTESMAYVPVGEETQVTMKAAWPHPSFGGDFLPDSRTITERGFEAAWKTSHLASSIESVVATCLADHCGSSITAMDVAFVDPVDVYLKSERAAKYGFLFIAITFLVFFLFEVLKKLAIHPVQYGLVGVALSLFFLLLLALSEHVAFWLAYAIATAACVGLLGAYVSYVLRGARRALGFTGLLTVLFGALYVLLQSEDFALLLGAGLLFGILAVVMLVTRRIDWYGLSRDGEQAPAGAE
jgi:inner membrane protein